MEEWIKETRINFYSLCEYIYGSNYQPTKETEKKINLLEKIAEKNVENVNIYIPKIKGYER